MKRMFVAAAAGAAMLAAGCETTDGTINNNTLIGAGIGAVGGYLACELARCNDTQQLAAVLGGAVAGGVIANRLDARDKGRRDAALASSVQAGSSTWSNPNTGNQGTFQQTRQYNTGGDSCSEQRETYTQNGQVYEDVYSVCQRPDGSVYVI